MKKCFGFISWFPDDETKRKARIDRLNKAFKQIHDLWGDDAEFLVVAQNWKDYKVPSFIKHIQIFRYDKLGILGARKKLREHFLKTNYDYLIMCDDDIVLEKKVPEAIDRFNKMLEKYPQGYWFAIYGWSLSFCAVSRWIYEREEMVDVDPEKGEGYEDTVFPNLLHYKYPKNEIFFWDLKFVQYRAEYHKDHKSTWCSAGKNVDHRMLGKKSKYYISEFKKGNFDVKKIKEKLNSEWDKLEENEKRRKIKENPDLPLLDECLDLYGY